MTIVVITDVIDIQIPNYIETQTETFLCDGLLTK